MRLLLGVVPLLLLAGCCCCGAGVKGPCEEAADACYDICDDAHAPLSAEFNDCYTDCASEHFDCSMAEEGF